MSKTAFQVLTITALLSFLIGYQFINASTWQNAPSNPPNANTEAPVNVGPVSQTKNGDLAVNKLTANNAVWASEYCDINGENCFSNQLKIPVHAINFPNNNAQQKICKVNFFGQVEDHKPDDTKSEIYHNNFSVNFFYGQEIRLGAVVEFTNTPNEQYSHRAVDFTRNSQQSTAGYWLGEKYNANISYINSFNYKNISDPVIINESTPQKLSSARNNAWIRGIGDPNDKEIVKIISLANPTCSMVDRNNIQLVDNLDSSN